MSAFIYQLVNLFDRNIIMHVAKMIGLFFYDQVVNMGNMYLERKCIVYHELVYKQLLYTCTSAFPINQRRIRVVSKQFQTFEMAGHVKRCIDFHMEMYATFQSVTCDCSFVLICSLRKERIYLMCLTRVRKRRLQPQGIQTCGICSGRGKDTSDVMFPLLGLQKPIVLYAIPDGRQQTSFNNK